MAFVPQGGRVRFVLVEPSHAGNIGSAARAINTMGFTDLYVVNPRDRDYKRNPEALSFCTRSADVLFSSMCVPDLQSALQDIQLAYALSGYDREFGPPFVSLTEACLEAKEALEDSNIRIAFVFGTERSGLTNEQVNQCQRCVGIPANPQCDSLNLAQAVQVTAYQLQTDLRGPLLSKESRRFSYGELASVDSIEKMFGHLQQAMVACGALDPQKPKFMMERFRHLFSRAGLTQTEVDLLRGVYSSIIRSKDERKGSKKL